MLDSRSRNDEYRRELELEQNTEVKPKKPLTNKETKVPIQTTLGIAKRNAEDLVEQVIEVDKPRIEDYSIDPPVQDH